MDALARNCNNLFFVIISIVVVLVVVLLISLGSRMCSTFSIFIVIHTNGSLCCWIFVTMLYAHLASSYPTRLEGEEEAREVRISPLLS